MSQRFIWKAAYEVGDHEIDEQHRGLFDLANTLLAADTQAELTHCTMQLYKYVHVHFNHEEAVMRQLKYPELEQHTEQHMGLLDRLNGLSLAIAAGSWRAEEVHRFMNEWLLGHIRDEDTRLAAFIRR